MITRNFQNIPLQSKYNSSNSYSKSHSHSPYQKFEYSPQNISYENPASITSNIKKYTIMSNENNSNFKEQKYRKREFEKQSENQKPQYQLLLEYQLKRQQQKNIILNERLKNKEEFIDQIKKIQQELTKAYSKCQQELNQANSRLFELQNYKIRNYLEEIQDLKHQIMQCENQAQKAKYKLPQKRPVKSKSNIILKNNNNRSNYQMSFRNNSNQREDLQSQQAKRIKSQYQTKNLTQDLKKIKQEGTGKILKINNFNSPKIYHTSTGNLPAVFNQNQTHKESVYLMNAHQLPKQAKPEDLFQQQILMNLHKVTNFIKHFIQMSKIYAKIDDQGSKITHKLKSCWRWIKQVVRQWDKYRQNQKESLNQKNHVKRQQIKQNEAKNKIYSQQQQSEFHLKNSQVDRSLKKSQIMKLKTQNIGQNQKFGN